MKIIVGLGNPGEKYEHTRHNVGFLALDFLAAQWDFPSFALKKKFSAEISSGSRDARAAGFFSFMKKNDILLAKPQTFMNNSGQSVRALMDFHKCSPADVIVFHDDIDLPAGVVRVATNSRAAGHNGVQSVIDHLGTQEFTRMRLGIRPHNEDVLKKIGTKDFVLQNFTDEELKMIQDLFPMLPDAI